MLELQSQESKMVLATQKLKKTTTLITKQSCDDRGYHVVNKSPTQEEMKKFNKDYNPEKIEFLLRSECCIHCNKLTPLTNARFIDAFGKITMEGQSAHDYYRALMPLSEYKKKLLQVN